MLNISLQTIIFSICCITFFVISKIIFLNVYDVSGYVIDEQFHIPQGLSYCQLNFTQWDPKITTLPGLYLVSTILLAPIGFCTIYGLRLTNLIAAFVNLLLFVSLFHLEHGGTKPLRWPAIISGLNLGILPPLYFFSHIYYTDTISVTTVLLMILFAKKGLHIKASIAGISSVIVRQTNVIWVVMLFGENILQMFVNITTKNARCSKTSNNNTEFWNVYGCCHQFFKKGCNFSKITLNNYISLFSYLTVMLAFIAFVFVNGSIVVGDKSAHEAVIHIPQVFYFSIFCIIFSAPHFCLEIFPFIKYVLKNKLLTFGLLAIFISIVHYNTIVHPYLLADNRHYTFYVWMRIYGKYSSAKYILTGMYIFSMYAALKRIDAIKNFGFVLVYVPCLLLVLIFQKLLEIRYFIIPFILLRLKFKTRNEIILAIEFLIYVITNYVTFYVFFTKEIIWNDFSDIQRIIW